MCCRQQNDIRKCSCLQSLYLIINPSFPVKFKKILIPHEYLLDKKTQNLFELYNFVLFLLGSNMGKTVNPD